MYRARTPGVRWDMRRETTWQPPTDVYETDDAVVVLIEIAGLAEGDYEIVVSDRTLSVKGERCDPTEKLAYHQMEIRRGKFRAQVRLPWALAGTGQQAAYENGFLKITLPKAQARRVPVCAPGDES